MRRLTRLFPVIMGGAKTPYDQLLINTYGASEVWPLVDIASGTTITAKVAAARNGTLTGWDLQNAAGPVAGTLAPYSDGVNDSSTIQTASLASIFNGAEGSAIVWVKTEDWTEVAQYEFIFYADGSNYITVRIDSANRINWHHRAGGTQKERFKSSVTTTGWMCLGLSWSLAAGEVRAYYNGVQEGVTLTSPGTWAGALTDARVGNYVASPASYCLKGWIAYFAVKFGSVWTPAQFAAMYAAATG